jgi:RNA polymerase sigma-70 factor (ECF subfamily)
MPGKSVDNSKTLSPEVKDRLNAVERAFRRHDRLLIGWLAKKFGDETIARDIAQDAFLRVWRSAHKTEIEDPRALIFKTAANLAANEFNARRRFRENHVDPASTSVANHIEMVAADDPSPERIASARQDYKACMEVIEELPEKVRAAFIKSRFEALTYREIADQLHVSESSVEKYIITALKGLRRVIAAPEEYGRVVEFSSRARKPVYSTRSPTKNAGA